MSTPVKTIRYSPEHLHQEFAQLLQNFLSGCQAENISRFLGNDLLTKIICQTNQIQQKLHQECAIVVIGDFKRGKSTLINALLQNPIVTTDVTPETITINEIKYGETSKINICLEDGGYINLQPEELKAEKLSPILAQYGDRINHLQIETPVEWLKGVRLVDTPGTGDIFHKFDQQVQTYLQKADVVVWVLSALTPLSESEQAFLKLAVLPQDFPKILFVINWMDVTQNEREAERLLNSSCKKISQNFPNAHIFAVSALDEFSRLQSLPRPNLSLASTLETYFQSFQNYLQQSIILNRDIIQLERAYTQLSQILNQSDFSINLIAQLIAKEQLSPKHDQTLELRKKIEKEKEEITAEITELRQRSHHWMIEFIERLKTETIAQLDKFSLDDIRCNFPFFLTEKLRQAIYECINIHQPIILEKIQKSQISILEDFHNLTDIQITGANLAMPSAALDDMRWQDMNAVQLLINLGRIGDIMRVLTALLGQEGTKAEKTKLVITYQTRLQEYLPELENLLLQHLDKIYTGIATNIEKQLETIYQQEIETSLAAIKQAHNIKLSQEENLESKNSALLLIDDTRIKLQLLREKLSYTLL